MGEADGSPRSRWALRTVPAELVTHYRDSGWWTEESFGQVLLASLAEHPDVEVVVHSDLRPALTTFAALADRGLRLAAGLRDRGVGPGDAVAFQLPNCLEAMEVIVAAAALGATIVPIVHFYGPKEVGYILRRTGVEAFITAASFGSFDYLANWAVITGSDAAPAVPLVAVLGRPAAPAPAAAPARVTVPADVDGPAGVDALVDFEDLVAAQPIDGPVSVDPATPALIAYTSGTTADPKGVIHTHQTLLAEMRQLLPLQAEDGPPNLTGAPIGHAMGMIGTLMPLLRGQAVHAIDVWNPERILQIVLEHGLSCGSGATFFLTSLLDHPSCTEAHRAAMRTVGLGGAAVPLAVAQRATDLGISIVRMYGSTEHPSITGGRHSDPLAQRITTDGAPLPGVEIRLVDDDGHAVPVGTPGEILSRGPDCAMGYTDPALTASAFTDDGWFRTEDVGVLDADGFLRITDRKKDIIIRGGENVSAAEVEELVAAFPEVAEVAVVAAPDDRMGERVCAVVRLVGDATLELADVRDRLGACGLGRQKWPEQLEVVADFPRTPSGKIQKVRIRERLREQHHDH